MAIFHKNLLIIWMFFPLFATAQSGIHGVITYYFNANFGYKPDVAAEVWLVDTSYVPGFDKEIVKQFMDGSPEDAGFTEIDKRTNIQLHKLQVNAKVKHTTVDGEGKYFLPAGPGSYYVFIRSSGRDDNTITGAFGKIYWKEVIISETQSSELSYKFDIRHPHVSSFSEVHFKKKNIGKVKRMGFEALSLDELITGSDTMYSIKYANNRYDNSTFETISIKGWKTVISFYQALEKQFTLLKGEETTFLLDNKMIMLTTQKILGTKYVIMNCDNGSSSFTSKELVRLFNAK